jgi:GNAT superfamily N-acetyltransferase
MTTQKIVIRDETKADVGVITDVTVAAFATMEISSHTEQFVIEALRSARALTLSLVAEVDGRVVGHIAFSPVVISDGIKNWYGLGRLSVLPEYQRRGIGKALIQVSTEVLRRALSLSTKDSKRIANKLVEQRMANAAAHHDVRLQCYTTCLAIVPALFRMGPPGCKK